MSPLITYSLILQLPKQVQAQRMQVLFNAAATSMMGIQPPAWDTPAEEKANENRQEMQSSTSLCGIAGCPHHQVMVLPPSHQIDSLPTVDDSIAPMRGSSVELPPLPTNPHMTAAATMTSPVMTSGTTIANHYALHHNPSLLPPHHPHYPQQRPFMQHHIGKINTNSKVFIRLLLYIK